MLYLTILLLVSPSRALVCSNIQRTVRNGYSLKGHLITTYSFLGKNTVCIEACAAHSECNSVNFYQRKKKCELNNGNHQSDPENMTVTIDSEYIDYPERISPKCLNKGESSLGR